MDGRLVALLLIFAVDIVSLYVITVIFVTTLGTPSNWKFAALSLAQSLQIQHGF